MRLVMILVLAIAAPAHADSPWVVTAGAGVTLNRLTSGRIDESGRDNAGIGIGARAVFGFRLHPTLAVGLQLGIGRATATTYGTVGDPVSYVPIDVGITAQYVFLGRGWVAPWIGFEDNEISGEYSGAQRLAYGIAIGGDVVANGRNRVTAFVTITQSEADPDDAASDGERYVGLFGGVGYRFW